MNCWKLPGSDKCPVQKKQLPINSFKLSNFLEWSHEGMFWKIQASRKVPSKIPTVETPADGKSTRGPGYLSFPRY